MSRYCRKSEWRRTGARAYMSALEPDRPRVTGGTGRAFTPRASPRVGRTVAEWTGSGLSRGGGAGGKVDDDGAGGLVTGAGVVLGGGFGKGSAGRGISCDLPNAARLFPACIA